jgi:hypothetical protein
MGRLDRTALPTEHDAHQLGLEHATWLSVLDAAHAHYAFMPYELAEIEECSLVQDEAASMQYSSVP